LRDDLKCPVCGESEIICDLSGCDQVGDAPPKQETDRLSFVLHAGDKIWEPLPLQFSNN
jgi:hypothetical protein